MRDPWPPDVRHAPGMRSAADVSLHTAEYLTAHQHYWWRLALARLWRLVWEMRGRDPLDT